MIEREREAFERAGAGDIADRRCPHRRLATGIAAVANCDRQELIGLMGPDVDKDPTDRSLEPGIQSAYRSISPPCGTGATAWAPASVSLRTIWNRCR
jgi:hypothetical protein